MRWRRLAVLTALLAIPRAGWAQGGVPIGPEFQVNTYTTSSQSDAFAAADSSGNFVIVWGSDSQDGSSNGIFAQRYDSSGVPAGPEFRVNTYTSGQQAAPSIASDASDNFVVVWYGGDAASTEIFAQRYAGDGAPIGTEFRVNTVTTNHQTFPAVAADPSGNFVVVWTTLLGGFENIAGQRYDSSAAPLGTEFRVNTYTTMTQATPSVAMDASGNFVVVWLSNEQDGSSLGVFAQRFAGSGAPLGPEFRVNTFTTSAQRNPSVAVSGIGDFVVTWDSPTQDGFGRGVFGQRFAASGTPLGPEFRVNSYTNYYQQLPHASADGSGNFVVVWISDYQDGSGNGIFGQRYGDTGEPLGSEFRVSTYTTQSQYRPVVATDPAGSFVVAWESLNQDGSSGGVFAQRFGQIVPVELMRFGVE